jgi:2,3-bisphosphoglycerate-dependent phosphoglycerate mutase
LKPSQLPTLVLLRHGHSIWNEENRFTGWTDVPLSSRGLREAREAGEVLRQQGHMFDVAFSSVLTRAIRTLWLVLESMDLAWVPVRSSWRLNELHHGALQGITKAAVAERYGPDRMNEWRRGFKTPPPLLTPEDERYPGRDPRYAGVPKDLLPLGESLEQTLARLLPYWHEAIGPALSAGQRVLVVSHGSCMRALVKYLDGISDEGIATVSIPTGIPLVYRFDEQLKPVSRSYLGDPKVVARRVQEADV